MMSCSTDCLHPYYVAKDELQYPISTFCILGLKHAPPYLLYMMMGPKHWNSCVLGKHCQLSSIPSLVLSGILPVEIYLQNFDKGSSDDSKGKLAFHSARQPEFGPWDYYDERKELTSTVCFLKFHLNIVAYEYTQM